MSGVRLVGDGAPAALQQLAREQMKTKLHADILMDLHVCELEGLDPHAYLGELHQIIARWDPCQAVAS